MAPPDARDAINRALTTARRRYPGIDLGVGWQPGPQSFRVVAYCVGDTHWAEFTAEHLATAHPDVIDATMEKLARKAGCRRIGSDRA